MPIKIAIVEDHSGIQESIAILINGARDFCARVHSHIEAVLRSILSRSWRSIVRHLNLSSACVGLAGFFILSLATGLAQTTPGSSPLLRSTNASLEVGSWIWAEQTHDQQTCRFWRPFEILPSEKIASAHLRITADNSYRVFLDGTEIGRGSEWQNLMEHDLSLVMKPGGHVLAVEAFSDFGLAGLILGLQVKLADGRVLKLVSDETWRVVPNTETGWQKKTRASESWLPAKVLSATGAISWWKPTGIRSIAPLHPVTLSFWQTGWFQITLLSICVIAILLCLRFMGQLALQSNAQQLLQRERLRIARDIHDDLGSGMTQLVLLGELAKTQLHQGSEKRAQMDQLCDKAREVMSAMDEIVWVVNSRRDTLHDFVTHTCKYTQSSARLAGIRCRLDVEPEVPALPFDLFVRRNLFLSVKEAISNAAKHSGATELSLSIHRQRKSVVVIVEDNGKGFDPASANPERNGLTNMAQRMIEVGGSYRLISQPDAGCRVEFEAPLAHARRRWRLWRGRSEPRNAPPEP